MRLQEVCTGAGTGQATTGQAMEDGSALTRASLGKHHGPRTCRLGPSPSSAQCLFSRESFTRAARQADAVEKPLKKLLALEWGMPVQKQTGIKVGVGEKASTLLYNLDFAISSFGLVCKGTIF